MADSSPQRGTVSPAAGDLNPWTALLAAMSPEMAAGGFTVKELVHETGRGKGACIELVRQGIAAGALRVGRKVITKMDGNRGTVSSYIPTEAA